MESGLIAYCPECGAGYRFYRDRDSLRSGIGGYIAYRLDEDREAVDDGIPFDWACLICGEGFYPSGAPRTRAEYERQKELKQLARRKQELQRKTGWSDD